LLIEHLFIAFGEFEQTIEFDKLTVVAEEENLQLPIITKRPFLRLILEVVVEGGFHPGVNNNFYHQLQQILNQESTWKNKRREVVDTFWPTSFLN
jgi:hypothetical protein